MKKVYLFQNIHSLTIYKFDLYHYDRTKDYLDILNFVLSAQLSSNYSNKECYALLVYILSSYSGFNKKHDEYKLVKSIVNGIFTESLVEILKKSFADKFRYLGKTTIVFNF